MRDRLNERRVALLGLVAGVVAPGLASAARPRLTLANGTAPPLTSAPGRPGFLDQLVPEVFGRVGVDVNLIPLPYERSLLNANAGIDDGDTFRAAGFEKDYPNLVHVPEKVLDYDFVAYATRPEVQVRQWSDLAPYSVGYIGGWKIYERNAAVARNVTTVRAIGLLFPLLASGRVDVVLLDKWQALWLARETGFTVRALEPALARVPMFTYLHRRHEALVQPLADALAQAKRDGTWQRLYDQVLKPLEAAR